MLKFSCTCVDRRGYHSLLKIFPIAIILKEKFATNSQTIAYETCVRKIKKILLLFSKCIKTVKNKALPVVTFGFIQSFRFEKVKLNGAQYTLQFAAGYTRELIFVSDVLGDDIRRNVYDYNVYEIPIYDYQVEYGRNWNSLKNFRESQLLLKVHFQLPST